MTQLANTRLLNLRKHFAILSFLLALVFPLLGWSQGACNQAHPQPSVLGDFRKNFAKPVVSQCGGTCYFEGGVAAMESSLSQFFGRPATLSRPHFFAEIMRFRLKALSTIGSAPNARLRIKNGQLNVMNDGGPDFMTRIANKSPFYVLGPKSRSYVEKENWLLQEIQGTSERILMDSFRNHQLTLQLSNFEQRLLNDPNLSMDVTPEIQAALQEAFPQITTKIEAILEQAGLNVGSPAKKIGFRVDRNYISGFDVDAQGKKHLFPEIEKAIIDRVSQGKELMLSYYHVKPYEERVEGRFGFLKRPESGPYLSRKEITAHNAKVKDPTLGWGGPHNTTLVDVIRGPTDRIEYLVIRNSWGQKETSDQGYYYISVDYLAEDDNLYIADLSIIRKPE